MKYRKYIVTTFLFVILCLLFTTTFFGNLWGCLIDPNYYIPKQSNLFIFNTAVMQNGSSDAWIYAEDYNNYYYNSGLKKEEIITVSKKQSEKCPNFNSRNINSWCVPIAIKTPL
ncbi:hypothetical protein [Flavobacterium poyangense]|uniref:hypothetical protein n=1 Tax=Flavobacterium poyangense TaxID=2204302 RepID=UPI001422E93A|nr:hypothetical protein [Flavobacterium sp. JXAS1]